ncbi:uncharacterized protein LOC129953610 [Eupeodes corollae]|uniref:uncharacterized protein LOC129953610 n=1 Tax=Eupeodes corollae TaxID=290404 RepID=UPI00248F4A7E|nr:uncharacterized protein LOC129953610 [Eupeodes corollae]
MEPVEENYGYLFQAAVNAIERMVSFCRSERLGVCPKEGVAVRLEALGESWAQLKAMERRLVAADDPLKTAEVERKVAEAEESYFNASAILKERVKELTPREDVDAPQIAVQVSMPFSQHDVKNTWGEFDGVITKWQGFRDRFLAAVHENKNISPAYKFAYLKGSLTGKAARTLGEWQLTESNYAEAWQRLNDVYSRQYATCRELLRQFFRLPSLMEHPRAAELERMSNVTHETMRQLKAQGIPTESWDMIVVHMLHERMDGETACKWEESRTSEQPTVREICAFLERRATALESAQSVRRREAPMPSTSAQALARAWKEEKANKGGKKKPCQACASMDLSRFFSVEPGRTIQIRPIERDLCQLSEDRPHAKGLFPGTVH